MSFNLSTVGYTTRPHALAFDWKTLATYALGIGAKREELAFLYEHARGRDEGRTRRSPWCPAHHPIVDMLGKCNANLAMVVHGGQVVRAPPPHPVERHARTRPGTIKGIYDMKKFGQVVLDTHTTLGGEPLFDTTWSIIVRGGGGFGGPRPPEAAGEPSVPKDRAPDWTIEEATRPEQALLYRISGDTNPLHADPEFAAAVGFPQGPILHGLCTYGFVARAILKHAAGGDAGPARRPRRPVPQARVAGRHARDPGLGPGGGEVALVTTVKGRPDPVLANAWARIG